MRTKSCFVGARHSPVSTRIDTITAMTTLIVIASNTTLPMISSRLRHGARWGVPGFTAMSLACQLAVLVDVTNRRARIARLIEQRREVVVRLGEMRVELE